MAKKFGDRKDGAKLRNIHAMHLVMPLMYPNRCDNEAFISERIDLTNVLAYLDEKNASDPDYKYNFFQVMVTTMLKVITLRPKMNRFIQGSRMYQRKVLTLSFVVKKRFNNESHEALAFQYCDGNTTIDTLHEAITKEITEFRGGKSDNSTDGMDMLLKFPQAGFKKEDVADICAKLDALDA